MINREQCKNQHCITKQQASELYRVNNLDTPDHNHHNHDLLKSYLVPYAFLWWGSLIFLSIGVFLLKKYFLNTTNWNPVKL